jgi:hypothetical protein
MTTPDPPSACAHGGAVRCWPCMTDGCFDTPTLHVWWDSEDIEHAAATGRPAPSGWCGCAFCGEPAVARAAEAGGQNR